LKLNFVEECFLVGRVPVEELTEGSSHRIDLINELRGQIGMVVRGEMTAGKFEERIDELPEGDLKFLTEGMTILKGKTILAQLREDYRRN